MSNITRVWIVMLVALSLLALFVSWEFWAFRLIDLKTGLGPFLLPLVLGPALLFVILWSIWLIDSVTHKRWQLAATILVVPALVGSIFAGMSAAGFTAFYFDFLSRRPSLTADLARAPADRHDASLMAWSWGETGWAGGNTVIYTLVYDSTDTIGRPRADRSARWLARAEQAAQGNSFFSVLHPEAYSSNSKAWPKDDVEALGQHFYLIRDAH